MNDRLGEISLWAAEPFEEEDRYDEESCTPIRNDKSSNEIDGDDSTRTYQQSNSLDTKTNSPDPKPSKWRFDKIKQRGIQFADALKEEMMMGALSSGDSSCSGASDNEEMNKQKEQQRLQTLNRLPIGRRKNKRVQDESGIKRTKSDMRMELFLREVEAIKGTIEELRNTTEKIDAITEQAIQATSTEEENQCGAAIRLLVDNMNSKMIKTKCLLCQMKEENKLLKDKKEINQSGLRVRQGLCDTLTMKIVEEMRFYQMSQQNYKTQIKEKITRQVKIIKEDLTDEEVSHIMLIQGGKDVLYRETLLKGEAPENIKTVYAEVAGKCQDVIRLEQSVAEIHRLFIDLALLTKQQGELIDSIEFQLRDVADDVEAGNDDVEEAVHIKKKIRKKQLLIIIVILFIILVFGISYIF